MCTSLTSGHGIKQPFFEFSGLRKSFTSSPLDIPVLPYNRKKEPQSKQTDQAFPWLQAITKVDQQPTLFTFEFLSLRKFHTTPHKFHDTNDNYEKNIDARFSNIIDEQAQPRSFDLHKIDIIKDFKVEFSRHELNYDRPINTPICSKFTLIAARILLLIYFP